MTGLRLESPLYSPPEIRATSQNIHRLVSSCPAAPVSVHCPIHIQGPIDEASLRRTQRQQLTWYGGKCARRGLCLLGFLRLSCLGSDISDPFPITLRSVFWSQPIPSKFADPIHPIVHQSHDELKYRDNGFWATLTLDITLSRITLERNRLGKPWTVPSVSDIWAIHRDLCSKPACSLSTSVCTVLLVYTYHVIIYSVITKRPPLCSRKQDPLQTTISRPSVSVVAQYQSDNALKCCSPDN